MGRVQLVSSVINGILLYSFKVYAWPINLLKSIEKWIRNFIWYGNIHAKKVVTIAWKVLCKPTLKGGLGLRSTRSINYAAMLHLLWSIMVSKEDWAELLRARFIRKGKHVSSYIRSSLWSGLKPYWKTVAQNSAWNVGDGSSVNFWIDN